MRYIQKPKPLEKGEQDKLDSLQIQKAKEIAKIVYEDFGIKKNITNKEAFAIVREALIKSEKHLGESTFIKDNEDKLNEELIVDTYNKEFKSLLSIKEKLEYFFKKVKENNVEVNYNNNEALNDFLEVVIKDLKENRKETNKEKKDKLQNLISKYFTNYGVHGGQVYSDSENIEPLIYDNQYISQEQTITKDKLQEYISNYYPNKIELISLIVHNYYGIEIDWANVSKNDIIKRTNELKEENYKSKRNNQ